MTADIAAWDAIQRFTQYVKAGIAPHTSDSREAARRLDFLEDENARLRILSDTTWEELTREIAARIKAESGSAILLAALVRLRDCDWTIGAGDRMDPVRQIVRDAITDAALGECSTDSGTIDGGEKE